MKYNECSEVIKCSIASCNCSKYLGAKITSKAEVFCSGDGRRGAVCCSVSCICRLPTEFSYVNQSEMALVPV